MRFCCGSFRPINGQLVDHDLWDCGRIGSTFVEFVRTRIV